MGRHRANGPPPTPKELARCRAKRKTWAGRVYLGRDESGREQYEWVGRLSTMRERDAAVAARRAEIEVDESRLTCVARVPARWITAPSTSEQTLSRGWNRAHSRPRADRASRGRSIDAARGPLRRFTGGLRGTRPLLARFSATRRSLDGQVASRPRSRAVVTLFNRAVDAELIDRNPFRCAGSPGPRAVRSEHPPTAGEFEALQNACDALDEYAPRDAGADDVRGLHGNAARRAVRPSSGRTSTSRPTGSRVSEAGLQGQAGPPRSPTRRRFDRSHPAAGMRCYASQRGTADLVFRSKRGERDEPADALGLLGQGSAPVRSSGSTSISRPSTTESTCSTGSGFRNGRSRRRWAGPSKRSEPAPHLRTRRPRGAGGG